MSTHIYTSNYNHLQRAYGEYILGKEAFVEKITAKFGKSKVNNEISERKYLRPRISIETIISRVNNEFPNDEKAKKKAAIYLIEIHKDGTITNRKIGKLVVLR